MEIHGDHLTGINLMYPMTNQDRVVLASEADAQDLQGQSIGSSLDTVRRAGWLSAAIAREHGGQGLGRGGAYARASVASFMDIAEANLSLARLFEGHVNALWLIDAYADADLATECAHLVKSGALFGVWGADGAEPVTWQERRNCLTGSKRFTSGLGHVARAVVPLCTSSGAKRLSLVDVTEAKRGDESAWNMRGMKATRSGTYSMENMYPPCFVMFGDEDDYVKEPGLVTGVWRIAAVQLGGIYSVLEEVRSSLKSRGRLNNDAQRARLGPLLSRAAAAFELIVKTAELDDGPSTEDSVSRLVAASQFVRVLTEELALDVIAAAERSLGLSHFCIGERSERVTRDLSTYIRQVAPDSFMQSAARTALDSESRLSRFWDGEKVLKC